MADFPSNQIDEPAPESQVRLNDWPRLGQLTEVPTNDPGLDPNTYRYFMRAYRALTPGYVQWDNLGWADLSGEQSGYDPDELTDIVVVGSKLEESFDLVPLALDVEMNAAESPLSVGGSSFIPPWNATILFRATLNVTNGATSGTVKLYNLSDGEYVGSATLTTSSTTPVTLEAEVTVGYTMGQMPPAAKIYEVHVENNGTLITDITYVGSVSLVTEAGVESFQSSRSIAKFYIPNRMPIDSDTYLYFDFQETAAPFVNQGSATGLNLVDITGAGVGYQAGIRGPIFGGRGLALDDGGQDAAVRADGTAAWAASEINVAVWVTVTDYIQENNYGRVFYKAWLPTAWAEPYHPFTFQFHPTGNFYMDYRPGGLPAYSYETPADLRVLLNTPHLLGWSHDGTTLRHYVDGIEVSNQLVGTTPASNLGTGPWCIGNNPTGGSSPYGGVGWAEKIGGIIEEIRVDEVARDADWWLENWQRGMGLQG